MKLSNESFTQFKCSRLRQRTLRCLIRLERVWGGYLSYLERNESLVGITSFGQTFFGQLEITRIAEFLARGVDPLHKKGRMN